MFGEFWQAYPRKKAKGAAKLAFEKALKKTTFDQIMAAVEQLKAEIELKETEPQFVPHASTWLNQERWEDDYDIPAKHRLTDEARDLARQIQDDERRRTGLGGDRREIPGVVQEEDGRGLQGAVLSVWGRAGVRKP